MIEEELAANRPCGVYRSRLELVRWEDCIRYLLAQGFDQYYEIGPGRVLRGLLRRIDREASCQSVTG